MEKKQRKTTKTGLTTREPKTNAMGPKMDSRKRKKRGKPVSEEGGGLDHI